MWIGALGTDDSAKGDLADALTKVTGDTSSYYVAVTTRDVNRKAAQGGRSCKLDAGMLTVSGIEGITAEHTSLLSTLGGHDVPVIVVLTTTESLDDLELEALKRSVFVETNRTLGYQAPVFQLPNLGEDISDGVLKSLAEEAQLLAAKRKHRKGKPGQTPKDYPFVIAQQDLQRLMQQNVRSALDAHRANDESVFVWRDGAVLELSGEQIDLATVPPRTSR